MLVSFIDVVLGINSYYNFIFLTHFWWGCFYGALFNFSSIFDSLSNASISASTVCWVSLGAHNFSEEFIWLKYIFICKWLFLMCVMCVIYSSHKVICKIYTYGYIDIYYIYVLYVCMHVCVYIYIYIYIYTSL